MSHASNVKYVKAPQVCQQGEITVIALGPEYENLDEPMLDHVREVMLDLAQSANPPRVVLDLSHTKFFGSAFIEILFRTWNRLKSRPGGRFAICGLTPYCAEVLEVTHLNRLWEICRTRDEALRRFESAPTTSA